MDLAIGPGPVDTPAPARRATSGARTLASTGRASTWFGESQAGPGQPAMARDPGRACPRVAGTAQVFRRRPLGQPSCRCREQPLLTWASRHGPSAWSRPCASQPDLLPPRSGLHAGCSCREATRMRCTLGSLAECTPSRSANRRDRADNDGSCRAHVRASFASAADCGPRREFEAEPYLAS